MVARPVVKIQDPKTSLQFQLYSQMNKYIQQLLPLAFLFLLLGCQSTRNSTSLEQNKEVIKDSAISINKQKETETTTIMWYFPTDSFKLKENPFLWIPLADNSGTSKNPEQMKLQR